MPLGLRNLGAFALRYVAQTNAYVLLLTGAYPYSGPCHEVEPALPTPPPVAPARRPPARGPPEVGHRMANLRRLLRPSAFAVLAGALLWAWAAHALWDLTPLPSQHLPDLDPHRYFSDSFLHRSGTFERFLGVEQLLAMVALVAVLVVYARHGRRLIRESAAGRVGTGLLLAMLGFAVVWLAEAPFGVVALWWERRYGVSHQGYLAYLLGSFLGLGSRFVFICLGFAIMMGLAGVMRRWWWLPAVPALVGLALLSTFVSPYLVPDTSPVRDPELARKRVRWSG